MKKSSILIISIMISLSAIAQGNELAENTPAKSQDELINEFNKAATVSIKLYPNPAVSSMVVEPKLQSAAANLRIINAEGKVVSERHVEPGINRLVFDVNNYTSGEYILALYDEEGKLLYVSKFNKN